MSDSTGRPLRKSLAKIGLLAGLALAVSAPSAQAHDQTQGQTQGQICCQPVQSVTSTPMVVQPVVGSYYWYSSFYSSPSYYYTAPTVASWPVTHAYTNWAMPYTTYYAPYYTPVYVTYTSPVTLGCSGTACEGSNQ